MDFRISRLKIRARFNLLAAESRSPGGIAKAAEDSRTPGRWRAVAYITRTVAKSSLHGAARRRTGVRLSSAAFLPVASLARVQIPSLGLSLIILSFTLLTGCKGLPTSAEKDARAQAKQAGADYRPLGEKPPLPALTP